MDFIGPFMNFTQALELEPSKISTNSKSIKRFANLEVLRQYEKERILYCL